MFDALSNDLQEEICEVNNRVVDNGIFKQTISEEKLLPETVIERVFDDLQSEHPLLSKSTFKTQV